MFCHETFQCLLLLPWSYVCCTRRLYRSPSILTAIAVALSALHQILFRYSAEWNKTNIKLTFHLPLDGPGVQGPAACAGPADATPTGMGLLALHL